MAGDDVIANPGSGGATFRALSEATTGVDWPASVVAFVTGGTPGAWTLTPVQSANPLPSQDAALEAAAGTPADVAWVSGNGSMVAVLKAIAGFLSSVVTLLTRPTAASGDATCSGSIGTAISLFSSAVPPNGFTVFNPSTSATLYVSDSTTTPGANVAGSIPLFPGGSMESTWKPVGVVYVSSDTASAPVTARRY